MILIRCDFWETSWDYVGLGRCTPKYTEYYASVYINTYKNSDESYYGTLEDCKHICEMDEKCRGLEYASEWLERYTHQTCRIFTSRSSLPYITGFEFHQGIDNSQKIEASVPEDTAWLCYIYEAQKSKTLFIRTGSNWFLKTVPRKKKDLDE